MVSVDKIACVASKKPGIEILKHVLNEGRVTGIDLSCTNITCTPLWESYSLSKGF